MNHFLLSVMIAAAQTDLRIEEVLAAQRQNQQVIQTLRVVWQYRHRYTPEWVEVQKAGAKRQGQTIPAETFAEPKLAWRSSQDVWTDGENLLVRSLHDPKEGQQLFGWEWLRNDFPNVETTPENLPKIFRKYDVFAVGRATGLAGRRWEAHYGGQRAGQGAVFAPSAEGNLMARTPPLVRPHPAWGVNPNLIDEFLDGEDLEYTLFREATLGSKQCVVVERVYEREPGFTTYGRLKTARAFLDPEAGFLPIRIEFYLGDLRQSPNWSSMGSTKHPPYYFQVVDEIELKQQKAGLIYPVSGTIRTFGAKTGKGNSEPELVVQEESMWKAELVEVNRPMTAEMFSLKFPPNTIFRDHRTGQVFLTGDREDIVKTLVGNPTNAEPASAFGRHWIWVAAVFVAMVGLGVWRRMRHAK
jgi:hypothetical protein